MVEFGYRDAVAVVQIVFFTIYLLSGIFLCQRHGWSRSSGFLILVTFSLLRLIGASFRLATLQWPTRSVYGGALICEAIGISPLTVLNLGLLGRANRRLPEARRVGTKVFTVLSLFSFAGIGLAIKGGIEMADALPARTSSTLVRVAVVLFLAVYAGSVAIFACLVRQRDLVPAGERRVLTCFAVCAPLILVRLVYALIGDFGNDARFSVFSGNTTIWLCMAVLEEIICVAVVVMMGLTLEKIPKPEQGATSATGEYSEVSKAEAELEAGQQKA